MLFYLLTFIIVLWSIDFFFKRYSGMNLIRKIPHPKESFLVGNALQIILPPDKLFHLGRIYAKTFNGIYGWWAFMMKTVNIYNPEDIEIITSSIKHIDKSSIYTLITPWLGDGLLLSKGAKWQGRRKILTPAFHFNILQKFYSILEDNSARLVEALKNYEGEPVDVVPLMSQYTLNTICETAMGTRLDEESSNAGRSYKNAVYALGNIFIDRFSQLYYHVDLIFNLSPIGRKSMKYLNVVHSFTENVIKERRTVLEQYGNEFDENVKGDDDDDFGKKKKKAAMLDLLILAEKDGLIDNSGIQEEVDTFMFEGHDTTAAGLNYCLMSIANNKEIQDKIVTELADIFGDSTRISSMEDLTKMRYLECCIKESLRLYPPVHFISRMIKETVKLSGYTVPAGTNCHIHIFDLHRREDLYKNALVFDPERFFPENSVGRHPYAYIPFSAGPRNCIGQRFAMMELKSCVAAVLRRYELLPVTRPEDLRFKSDLVLRNTGPVYVKFQQRA